MGKVSRMGEELASKLGCDKTKEKDTAPALDRIITIATVAQPARFLARSMENKKSKVWLYQFARLPNTQPARKLGVYHGLEAGYVLGNLDRSEGYDDKDMELSGKMTSYWVNFAKTGDPNGQGLPDWPAYESKTDLNLEFSDTIRIHKHLLEKECDFMGRLSPK